MVWGFEPPVLVEGKWETPPEPPNHWAPNRLLGKALVNAQWLSAWTAHFSSLLRSLLEMESTPYKIW